MAVISKGRELLTGSHGDNHTESNRRRAIVKKTLSLDEHKQTALGLRFLESCDDGNRVGRGNENAEHQCAEPLPVCQIVHSKCGNARGKDNAQGCQNDYH